MMHNFNNDDNDAMATLTAMINLDLGDRHHPTKCMMTETREIDTDLDHNLGAMIHVGHHHDPIAEQPQGVVGDQGHLSNKGDEIDVTIATILG
mgnify:CR=1 FL=1